jgi:hypothetical protein
MATAGASIASMVRAEAATTAAAALRPSTVIMLTAMMIVATADRTAEKPTVDRAAVANITAVERLMAAERTVVEHPTVAAERTVAELLMAAVVRTVAERTVVADTLVASTGNQ